MSTHKLNLFIDGLFLQRALLKTRNDYTVLRSDRKFKKFDIQVFINHLLGSYDPMFKARHAVEAFLLKSAIGGVEGTENLHSGLNVLHQPNGQKIQLHFSETADFVVFSILDQMKQLGRDERVMLVADDILYESDLAEMAGMGLEIITVMFTERDGNQMMAPGGWGDVTVPVALSLGLKSNEL